MNFRSCWGLRYHYGSVSFVFPLTVAMLMAILTQPRTNSNGEHNTRPLIWLLESFKCIWCIVEWISWGMSGLEAVLSSYTFPEYFVMPLSQLCPLSLWGQTAFVAGDSFRSLCNIPLNPKAIHLWLISSATKKKKATRKFTRAEMDILTSRQTSEGKY